MTKPELKKGHEQWGFPLMWTIIERGIIKPPFIESVEEETKKTVMLERNQSIWNNNVIFLQTDVANRRTESIYVLKGSEDWEARNCNHKNLTLE